MREGPIVGVVLDVGFVHNIQAICGTMLEYSMRAGTGQYASFDRKRFSFENELSITWVS